MLFCRSCTRAAIADDALVVRAGGAVPRLWRAPLADLAHATLSVDSVTEGGKAWHRLLVNKASGSEEIARFDTAKDAERAFMKVSDRLLEGQSGVRARQRPFIIRVGIAMLKIVIWIAFLYMVALIVVQFFLGGRTVDTGTLPTGTKQVERPQQGGQAAPAAPAEGVAVPADQLFGQ